MIWRRRRVCNGTYFDPCSVCASPQFLSLRKPFHKKCVKCRTCGKGLTPATLNEHETQLYCNVGIVYSFAKTYYFDFQPCYENIFIAHDYVCGKYGGIVTPEVGFITKKTMTTTMMRMVCGGYSYENPP